MLLEEYLWARLTQLMNSINHPTLFKSSNLLLKVTFNKKISLIITKVKLMMEANSRTLISYGSRVCSRTLVATDKPFSRRYAACLRAITRHRDNNSTQHRSKTSKTCHPLAKSTPPQSKTWELWIRLTYSICRSNFTR